MTISQKAQTALDSAKSRLGDPYVFAARGESCTPSQRRGYARSDYPNIVGLCPVLNGSRVSCTGCKWEGTHIYDCRGFTYRVWQDAGIKIEGAGATSQYNTKSNWASQGTIDTLPECVCCVFKYYDGRYQHTGLYIGNGQIIHCSGTVKQDAITKAWTHWAIPKGAYTQAQLDNMGVYTVVATLKKGSAGNEVRTLQENLFKLGYSVGGIDGKFGDNTASAVRQFQADHNLVVDGIAGSLTQAALREALSGKQEEQQQPQEQEYPGAETRVTIRLEEDVARQLLHAIQEAGIV